MQMSSEANPNSIQYPDGNVLLRNLERTYPTVSHGKGMYLFDKAGNRYIDAVGGAFVASVGHGNQEVVDRISEQLSKVAFVNGMQFTSDPTESLAQKLVAWSRELGLNRCAFLCSGTETIEAAFKFARQLWFDRGETRRSKFITRIPSYHGSTLLSLSASGRPHYKKVYEPMLSSLFVPVSAPYEYRCPVKDYEKDGASYYAEELEEAIQKASPNEVAAFIAEPIVGSSAGGSVPPHGYFDRVQEICRKHGILIIADEVLAGSGRTGKFYSCDHFGLKPDLLVLGKGVAGGYSPLSVLMVKDEHLREMKASSGRFMHAQTYLHSPSMTVAGLAVQEYFEKHAVLQNVEKMGALLHQKLQSDLLPMKNVGAVMGKGLLAGVEFVEEKKSKKPFDRGLCVAEKFTAFAQERGLIVWPNGGQAGGVHGDLVMLGPPLNIGAAEIEEIVANLRDSVQAFFQKRR